MWLPDQQPKALYQYWLSKHVEGRPPSRSEIDPALEVPRLVPNLMLIDVTPEGYRYRLVGSQIAAWTGLEFTGKAVGWVGGNEPAVRDWLSTLDTVVARREPKLVSAKLDTAPLAKNVMLVLPLVLPNNLVEKILVGSFFNQHFPPGSRLTRLIAQEVTW